MGPSRLGGTGRSWASNVYLDGIVLKRSWAGEVRNVSLLVAIGVNAGGYREILGICEGAKEDKAGWSGFLKHLKERGLIGVRLIISDACLGLFESAAEFFPEAHWQRCIVHWYRNIQPRALDQGAGDRDDAQGDPCRRGHCRGARKGHPSNREAARLPAHQGSGAR
jgi:hypothetical protein